MAKPRIDEVPTQDSDYQAEIDRYIAKMEALRQDMADDQRAIEQLRAETRARLTEAKAVLDKLAAL